MLDTSSVDEDLQQQLRERASRFLLEARPDVSAVLRERLPSLEDELQAPVVPLRRGTL